MSVQCPTGMGIAEGEIMYQVLARKYRPSKLSEVLGQTVATTILKNAIEAGKLHHAILLSGPMGTGKTSIARIIAKSINCTYGPTVEPCGKCEACVAISKGSDVDVIEIDGASNRKIENARNIIESIKYPPLKRRFKVYIIDEVHMLTQEAFNALLKTIEEPPNYVKFILATTSIEKVPETVLSRCQILTLRKISQKDIEKKLDFISNKENIQIEREALQLIAYASNGSLRVAEGYLDRCITYKPTETITKEDVSLIIGVPTISIAEMYTHAITDNNLDKALNIILELNNESKNLEIFCKQILENITKKNLPLEKKTAFMNIYYSALVDIKQKIDPVDALNIATHKAVAANSLDKIEELIAKFTDYSNMENSTEKPLLTNQNLTKIGTDKKYTESISKESKKSNIDIILRTFGGKIISIEKTKR